jgi:hypothetical protein
VPDDGRPDPLLAAALADGDAASVWPALLSARVLLPVVALTEHGMDAQVAVPALVAADGARALPVFSCSDELRNWLPEARPVPMTGARVIAGARAQGYDAVVLDVAGGRTHTLTDGDLGVLAAAAEQLLVAPGTTIVVVSERGQGC